MASILKEWRAERDRIALVSADLDRKGGRGPRERIHILSRNYRQALHTSQGETRQQEHDLAITDIDAMLHDDTAVCGLLNELEEFAHAALNWYSVVVRMRNDLLALEDPVNSGLLCAQTPLCESDDPFWYL